MLDKRRKAKLEKVLRAANGDVAGLLAAANDTGNHPQVILDGLSNKMAQCLSIVNEGLSREEISHRQEAIKDAFRGRMAPDTFAGWLKLMQPKFDEELRNAERSE